MSEPEVMRPAPEGLFLRQIRGILRLELRKNLFSRRAFAVYFLAFAPVALLLLWAVTPLPERAFGGPAETIDSFSTLFVFYLRGPIYLSALLVFTSLFRAEIMERSLHYYFLTPVRREILVAGKYLSALVGAWVTFIVATAALYLLMILPFGLGDASRYFFQGPGLGNLVAYETTAVLALAGYGAVFLLAGQFFKNPIVPGAIIWIWEAANPVLPELLKKVSVIFYLQSFYPVPPPERALPGPLAFFRVVVEPPPAWASIFGLLVFTGLVIAAAGWRAKIMEVAYGDD